MGVFMSEENHKSVKFTNNRVYDELFVKEYMPEKCLLCGSDGLNKFGHIIPKLAMRWLKSAGNKKRFFLNNDPSLLVQDTHALKILCDACERKFSDREKHFTDKYYKRYYRRQEMEKYTGDVYFFAISVAWRLIVSTERLRSTERTSFSRRFGGMEKSARKYLLNTESKLEIDVYILSADKVRACVAADRINEDLLNYSISCGLKAHDIYDARGVFLMTPLQVPTVSFKIGAYYFVVVPSGYFDRAGFIVDCQRCSEVERLYEVNCTEAFLGFLKWMMDDRFNEVKVDMKPSDFYLRRDVMPSSR